ncbi:FtsW/RodA/SpoVE family cell cycle protein [Prevotella dentasini]|uniref:FtsW/RodA/SpoVE family cell cycle protein n=1 Tax=Prevotella dentasini TaxID=589537 RepID=UPI00046A3606|nr:FtsW/RodA/SpoVE family cell cycle protein [Prevotella dentasini]
MNNKSFSNIIKGDKVIWMVFFFLCIISIIEVYSASSSLSYKGGNYWSPIIKHCGLLALGTCMMVVVLNIKCKYFRLATPFLLFFAFITLIWVLFAGETTNGANRWTSILGIQFQPSELAKGALVLAVAQILSRMQTDHGADRKAFKYILIVSFFMIGPIVLENLSTAMLLSVTVLLMMFYGRVPMKQLGRLLGIFALGAVLAVSVIMLVGGDKGETTEKENLTEQTIGQEEQEDPSFAEKIFHRASTWKARIRKFFDNKEVPPHEYDLDKDGQIGHSNIAIASSNIVGKGPGNSTERDFLSQAFSDFIYSIIIEEMGIEGAAFVAFLYIFLLFRTGIIANRCENAFPAYLAMGIALLLVTQALFNMLVAVGLAPVTGQPLPLISKGGTSTIINCIYIGVILSISRSAKKKDRGQQAASSGKAAAAAAGA